MSEETVEKEQPDLVAEGFTRFTLEQPKAPKILWGRPYQMWGADRKVSYLEGLAYALNHACDVIQKERDELLKLCGLKERQLMANQAQVAESQSTLHTEIQKLNEDRQKWNESAKKMNERIRELESQVDGSHD